MNQKQTGIIISYINLVLGVVVNIFLTPILITSLGDVDYSLYKVMQSFAGPLAMFNLGISTIVTRSIVQCRTQEQYTKRNKQNTMAMALLSSAIMAVLVSIVGIVMCMMIPTIYGNSYSAENVVTGQKIFLMFMASTVFHILTDAFSGCLLGYERFAVSSGIQFFRTIFRALLWFVFLKIGLGVVWIAGVDMILSFAILAFSALYSIFVLKETPRLYYFDGKKVLEILLFGFSILLQAVVNQVNNSVDTMILGAYVANKVIITMYSSALVIYSLYNSLVSVIAHFFLPKAARLVYSNATGEELTDFVIGLGRFQAVLAVGCILGFALFGQNFIQIWIGPKYMDAYWVALMLMIPVTIPLVENGMIAVLDATLKRIYRSVMLVIMAVLNVVATLLLINVMDFWGAALGTVLSLIVGHGIMMNIYYAREFKIQIGRMFYSIFKGILPAGLAAGVLCLPAALFLPDTIIFFIVKCLCFIVLYIVFLMLFGLNKQEKNIMKNMLKRKSKKPAQSKES